MSDWTAGYVADIGYTYGYYHELNPLRETLAFLSAGLTPPKLGTHCELGFGQGVSVNIHAAASDSVWYGTDFNPAQAGYAQSLAAASGAQANLYDQAFAEFCARDDLPEFDSVGLHGIWSWISDENRAVIVDFIRRKLKVGGVLYISYNTQPGWAATIPLRDLLTEHAEVMGTPGQGIVNRIDGAIAFAEKLLTTNPGYVRANPQIVERLKKIKEQNRNYLAHEYFNRDWLPMSFSRMAQWLVPAKLSYAVSAHFLDQVDAVNLSNDQQALLKEIPDPLLHETTRDFMVNQQFRRDYLVGAGPLLTVQDDATTTKVRKRTDKLNAVLCGKARGGNDVNFLASPVTGGGISVSRVQQLFLLALAEGKKQPAEWPEHVWRILVMQGHRALKDGKALESAEENLAELTAQASGFAEKQLPILKALQIA
ncbi:MAG: class I SAM-dependent methyltransferase [Proteobacteria bacterium]|nr:class I SAM-dependent methyltransferase [Pseudomonadota bacterium]